jgi:hypothetical protein
VVEKQKEVFGQPQSKILFKTAMFPWRRDTTGLLPASVFGPFSFHPFRHSLIEFDVTAGLPEFSWYNIPKRGGGINQMTTTNTKWP